MKTYMISNGNFDGDHRWENCIVSVLPLIGKITFVCLDERAEKYFKDKGIETVLLPQKYMCEHEFQEQDIYEGFNLYELTEYDRWQSYHWGEGIGKKTFNQVYQETVTTIDRWLEFFKDLKECKFILMNPAPVFRKVPELLMRQRGWEVRYINEYFNRIYFDKVGHSQRSSINHVWNNLKMIELTPQQELETRNKVQWLHDMRESRKYENSDKQIIDINSKEELLTSFGLPSNSKIILQLEQFPFDANKIIHSPLIKTKDEYIRPVVNRLKQNESWVLLVKRHPEDTVSKDEDFIKCFEECPERCRLVDCINIHDLLRFSDIVITLNSMAGLEALTYCKPVITIANAIYAQKGFTFDVKSLLEYEDVIQGVINNPELSSKQKIDIGKFLHYLMFETGEGKWE